MDPNATLKMIHDFLTARKAGEEVDIWCQNLYDWIAKGGFEPDWQVWELGTSYYECRKFATRKCDK